MTRMSPLLAVRPPMPTRARFGAATPGPTPPPGWEGQVFTADPTTGDLKLRDPNFRLAGTTLSERTMEATRLLALWGEDTATRNNLMNIGNLPLYRVPVAQLDAQAIQRLTR